MACWCCTFAKALSRSGVLKSIWRGALTDKARPTSASPHPLQRRLRVLLLAQVSAARPIAAAISSMVSMRSFDELLDRHFALALIA